MKNISLNLRYITVPAEAPVYEKQMVYATIPRHIPPEQAAIVMVDVWNDLFDADFMVRAQKIIETKIAPLSQAFRSVGSLVVHAPSNRVALKYPDFLPKLSDVEIWGNPQPKHNWPPKDFLEKKGPYCTHAKPESATTSKSHEDIINNWAIAKEVIPQSGDIVIRTGEELHHILEKRKILYLFYVGFASNICMLNRDYGMKHMSKRGFEIILARDATTGVEYAHTTETLSQTSGAITMTESNIGFSVTTQEILDAIKKVKA